MSIKTQKLSRRDFLKIKHSETSNSAIILSLDPYEQPLTLSQVYHLLRRTTFGISYQVAKQLVGKTAHEAVEFLLDNAQKLISLQPPSWINEGFYTPFNMPEGDAKANAIRQFLATIRNQNQELKLWWMKLMLDDSQSIREKMTLFWHGHFCSDLTIPAQYIYRQNQLFRNLHQGNFKEFIEKITLDGAMLLYLNGQDNHKNKPNENYARELLELFTMGIGNYTEWDVREIAKSLTGWRTNYFIDNQASLGLFKTYLDIEAHNFDMKLFLDELLQNNFSRTEENVFKYEVQLLAERILKNKTKAVANFMSKKIYRFFVYSNPSETSQTVIDALAQVMIKSNFNFRAVLAQLLKSKHFFDENMMGIQIKTPADMMLGFTKHFPVDLSFQEKIMTEMGQELLNPPNVSGWSGYRNWINTKTLPLAIATFSEIIDKQPYANVARWAKQFPNYESSRELTQAISDFFLSKKASTELVKSYENKLLGGSPDYEWLSMTKNDEQAGFRIKQLIKELIKAPDFYLC